MFPILQLGPLALQLPGLFILAGIWLGLALAEQEAPRFNLHPDRLYNLVFIGLVVGLVAARLVYVWRYPAAYLADPLGVFSLNPAALAPAQGALFGLLAAFVYGARRALSLRPTLDALAPALAAMGVAVALAHLSSGDAFGAPARLPWSIFLWEDYRHPSQIYELAGAAGTLGVWAWRRARRSSPGFNFLLVVALTASARVGLEAFRGDSFLILNGLRAAQVWGLVMVAGCLFLMWHWRADE